jgi:hypothetical protein
LQAERNCSQKNNWCQMAEIWCFLRQKKNRKVYFARAVIFMVAQT